MSWLAGQRVLLPVHVEAGLAGLVVVEAAEVLDVVLHVVVLQLMSVANATMRQQKEVNLNVLVLPLLLMSNGPNY